MLISRKSFGVDLNSVRNILENLDIFLLKIVKFQRDNIFIFTIVESVVLVKFFVVPFSFPKKFLVFIKSDLEAIKFSKIVTGEFFSSVKLII